MKIAIIDDLRTECELLSEYIHRYSADHQLDAEITLFESGSRFLECFTPQTYDLIFLDIYMDGLNGIETAEKIREKDSDCQIGRAHYSKERLAKVDLRRVRRTGSLGMSALAPLIGPGACLLHCTEVDETTPTVLGWIVLPVGTIAIVARIETHNKNR